MLRKLIAVAALFIASIGVAFGESASSIPTRVPTYWGTSASPSLITCPIPTPSQIPISVGRASWTDGFPPANALPSGAGGVPPFIQDFNGVFCQISQWTRWFNAGGAIPYNNTFQSAIGGYPKNAIIASGSLSGVFWLSTVDNNTSNPDSGGANWLAVTPAATPATGQVYLSFVSGSQVKLCPQNGSNLVVNKIAYTVPAACITSNTSGVYVNGVAGQALSNGVYDAFIFVNSGTLTFDFYSTSSGVHIPDTNAGNVGIEVRSNSGTPDSTRSYVGKIALIGGSLFQQGIGVISWFNQRNLFVLGTVVAGPSSTQTAVELNGGARTLFLTFGTSAQHVVAYCFTAAPQTAGTQALIEPGLGAGVNIQGGTIAGRTQNANAVSLTGYYDGLVSEGQNLWTVVGQGDIGFTATFSSYRISINLQG